MAEKNDAIQARQALWKALSTLFLDTEPDSHDYRYIARIARENDFSITQVKHIFENEVAPACAINLFQVAGEWAYFDEAWLFTRIQKKRFNTDATFFPAIKFLRSFTYRSYLREEWEKLEKYLHS